MFCVTKQTCKEFLPRTCDIELGENLLRHVESRSFNLNLGGQVPLLLSSYYHIITIFMTRSFMIFQMC